MATVRVSPGRPEIPHRFAVYGSSVSDGAKMTMMRYFPPVGCSLGPRCIARRGRSRAGRPLAGATRIRCYVSDEEENTGAA